MITSRSTVECCLVKYHSINEKKKCQNRSIKNVEINQRKNVKKVKSWKKLEKLEKLEKTSFGKNLSQKPKGLKIFCLVLEAQAKRVLLEDKKSKGSKKLCFALKAQNKRFFGGAKIGEN